MLPAGRGRWSPLLSPGEAQLSTGLPGTRQTWTQWRKSREGTLQQLRDWTISLMGKGWELFNLEKRMLKGILPMCNKINTWSESVKRMESDCFQWCPLTGEEALGSGKPGTFHLNIQKHFSPCRWLKTGTGCPGRLSLHPWKYSLTLIDTALGL